ncbi:MAG TPA: zinc ABC transporter substrate-binding protein [Jatrophihabitans sp.]|nr:zinc ABC transporter substrate-binding protein [Jatrophihabitans sp.]
MPSSTRPARARGIAAGLALVIALTGCAVSAPRRDATIIACASIDAWGSILSELGGPRVRTSSIVHSPAVDPHDYEPTPSDAKLIAMSSVFVFNGAGYDGWAAQAVRADPEPGRQLVDVGRLTGTSLGDNPHRWYSPPDVTKVADAITAAFITADPADADYFRQRNRQYLGTGLAEYHRLIAEIRSRYAGTPVGASESVFSPLADALGLRLITPPDFLRAISQGTDPSVADKARIDAQIAGRQIAVYVLNSQNATPDVAEQVRAARRAGIAVVDVTETPDPAGSGFADWQVRQLRELASALAAAVR